MTIFKNPFRFSADADTIDAEEWEEVYEKKYAPEYNEEKLWKKIGRNFKSIGVKLAYKALQLYYVTKNPKCPARIKAGIYGALGYLIVPIDAVADFLPFIGYTDDLTVIAAAILLAQLYIDDEVKEKAQNRLVKFFGPAALEKI